jgi:hypothetical protein
MTIEVVLLVSSILFLAAALAVAGTIFGAPK